jgi:hypothetical protein
MDEPQSAHRRVPSPRRTRKDVARSVKPDVYRFQPRDLRRELDDRQDPVPVSSSSASAVERCSDVGKTFVTCSPGPSQARAEQSSAELWKAEPRGGTLIRARKARANPRLLLTARNFGHGTRLKRPAHAEATFSKQRSSRGENLPAKPACVPRTPPPLSTL